MKQKNKEKQNKQKTPPIYPLLHTFMGSTIRQKIAQMSSPNKIYILCFLAIITKWCHMIAGDKRQHRYDGR